MAAGGTLDLLGVVNGGTAEVGNGNVEIGKSTADNVNVSFTAAGTGGLELAVASSYDGQITGFGGVNNTNTTQFIDLIAITSAAGKITDSYTGNTQSGVLKVSSGTTVVATLSMTGDYSSSNFVIGADASHHVKITDPSASAVTAGGSINTPLFTNYIAASLVTAAGQGGTSLAPEHHVVSAPLVNPHE